MEEAGGARCGGPFGEFDGGPSVVAAGTGDDRPVDRLGHGTDQFDLLIVGEGGALAGSARNDQTVVPPSVVR